MQHKAIYRQYQELNPRKQAVFAEKHHAEITLFQSAECHLKSVMNGRTTLPIEAWRAERIKLATERKQLENDYASLKGEVKETEQIRKSIHSILRQKQEATREDHILRLWSTIT